MIRSFRNKQTEDVFNRRAPRGLQSDVIICANSKLRFINIATVLADLRVPPSNRLEKLSGDRAGQWSVRINDQWRICFEWRDDNNAYEVEICEYQ